jgi:PAS domain S-box-containing protein
MDKRKGYSLYISLAVVIIFIVTAVMGLQTYYNYISVEKRLIKDIKDDAYTSLNQLKNTIKPYVEAYSVNEYEKLILSEMGHKSTIAIIVQDYNMAKIMGQKKYTVGKIRDQNWKIIEFDPLNTEHLNKIGNIFSLNKVDVLTDTGEKIAAVKIYSTDRFMQEELKRIVRSSIITTLVIYIFLMVSLFIYINNMMLKPILKIISSISKSDKEGIPVSEISSGGSKEILTLTSKINNMLDTIKSSRLIQKELNERFELAMDATKDGLWDWNPATNKVYFNNTWKEMLGYKENEIKNDIKEWSSRVHPDDIEKTYFDLQKHLDDKTLYYENIHRLKHKDGHWIWILDRGKALFDKNNKPYRVIGFHTDISKQKNIEKELENQKQELQMIFDNAKDGIAIFDLDTRFLKFNSGYIQMTGFSEEELYSKSCLELTPVKEREKVKKILQRVIETGEAENFEKNCVVKDDKIITINMSLSLLPDKKRLLATTKDMTRFKLMESQAKLVSMGEMIGNIAHQWRQPLSIITTSVSAIEVRLDMEGSVTNEEILTCTQNVINQANYLSSTIDDFRNFLKDEHSQRTISIVSTLRKTLVMVEPTLVNNYIKPVLDIKDDIELLGNENEFVQSFINIINNSKDAIKENLSKNDDRYIFISTKALNNGLEVTFKDNGGGIDDSIKDRIFEPYFSTKHQSIGTGIGLSMVHTILAERYNASIDVVNTEYNYNSKFHKGALIKIVFKK